MDMRAFDVFLEVARRGSFAAAARALDTDPSNVSRQVAGLEEDIGFVLFTRTTRRLTMTEAGQMVFERLAGPVEEIRDTLEAARDLLAVPTGQLTVTASVGFGEGWLMPRIAGFMARFPQLTVDMKLTDAIVDLVAENIDVGLRLGCVLEGGFVVSRLMDTNYHVVASPDYIRKHGRPELPSQLRDHECVHFSLPGFGTVWKFCDRSEQTEDVTVSGRLRTGNALAIRRAALEGLGIAMLADWTISSELADESLIDLFPDYRVTATDFETAAWIVYPSRAYVPAKTRVFIDYLRETCRTGLVR